MPLVGVLMKLFLRILKNIAVTAAIMTSAYYINILIETATSFKRVEPMIYLLAVFFVAVCTDSFVYGAVSSVAASLTLFIIYIQPASVIGFTFNLVLAIIIVFVASIMVCALTVYIKRDKKLKRITANERMRADLMRAISHDLRTPLTSIYVSSSTILDSYHAMTPEQRLELVKDIKNEANDLIRMTENGLLIARMSDDKVKLARTAGALDELIDATVAKFKKHYPDCPFDFEIPDEPVFVAMDAMLMSQVLSNLLENAVFHAKGMTKLLLRISATERDVLFEVIDDGCGLPKEGIFPGADRKKRRTQKEVDDADRSQSGRHNMGIGLSVSSAIVKAHDGELKAENNEKGGTTFYFKLTREAFDE